MKKRLLMLIVVPMLGLALVGSGFSAQVQPAQAAASCATITWITIGSASVPVSGGTLTAAVQAAYDSHNHNDYCGGLRGKGTLTKPSGGGGTLTITLFAGGTWTGSTAVPNGSTTQNAYAGPSYVSDCGRATATFAGTQAIMTSNRCAA
ncbi:MAG: hypothetical protein H0X24_20255 [Ktedonobacterales bacterium]|nr:hypothetical protein [Ktedonobacterales bacterium]